jgi:hypothetical protein
MLLLLLLPRRRLALAARMGWQRCGGGTQEDGFRNWHFMRSRKRSARVTAARQLFRA